MEMFENARNIVPTNVKKQHWTQPNFSYMDTPRPDHGVMLLMTGNIDFCSATETLSAKAGDVIFLPKNSYYEARFLTELGEIDDYLINFEADGGFEAFRRPTMLSERASFSCVDYFRQFVEGNYNSLNFDLRSRGMFYLLLSSIFSGEGTSDKNTALISKVKSLLTGNKELAIKEIAQKCCVSESGLRKIFKENTGITPVQYRINEKISRAKYLLESTDLSVDEIADSLNFFDTAYFCKVFSKHTGMPPGKYAKNKKL